MFIVSCAHKLLGYYFVYTQFTRAAPVMCTSHIVVTHAFWVNFIMRLKTDFWCNTTQNILPSKQVHEAVNNATTENYTERSSVFSMAVMTWLRIVILSLLWHLTWLLTAAFKFKNNVPCCRLNSYKITQSRHIMQNKFGKDHKFVETSWNMRTEGSF